MLKYFLTLVFLFSFVFGTCAGYFGYAAVYPLIFCCLSGFSALFFKGRIKTAAKFIFVLFLGLSLGQFYYHTYRAVSIWSYQIPWNKKVEAECQVTSEPKISEKGQSYFCKLMKPYEGKIKILSSLVPEVSVDQYLKLTLDVRQPSAKDFYALSFYPKIISAKFIGDGSWVGKLVSFKIYCLKILKAIFPQEEAALMSGLLFGYTGDFSEEFRNFMRQSGTVHLVALSGFNITILVYVASRLFKWPKVSLFSRFFGSMVLLSIFLGMVGYSSSVARAAIMGFFLALGRFSGRLNDFYLPIAWSAFFLTLLDPSSASADVGFQLSFLSLLGVSVVAPALSKVLNWQGKTSKFNWRENMLTTAGAQIAVLPILVASFGMVSIWSILTNVLILELVPWLMLGGAVSIGLGFIAIRLTQILVWPLLLALRYVLEIIKIFGGSNWQVVLTLSSNAWIILYYAAIVMFVVYVNIKNKTKSYGYD